MGLYSKFNVNLKINGKDYIDCRAFYFDGKVKRVGADENNNCENCLTESEVEEIALSLNIPFSSLKTEIETMENVPLPDSFISEFESFKSQNQFIGYAKVSNMKASQLVPKTEFSKFDIFNADGSQKKWKEFLEFSQKNTSYFLKIVMNNEADFKLFYDYFTTSAIVYQVLTTSEYEIFQ